MNDQDPPSNNIIVFGSHLAELVCRTDRDALVKFNSATAWVPNADTTLSPLEEAVQIAEAEQRDRAKALAAPAAALAIAP
jgi:hypothetical protein